MVLLLPCFDVLLLPTFDVHTVCLAATIALKAIIWDSVEKAAILLPKIILKMYILKNIHNGRSILKFDSEVITYSERCPDFCLYFGSLLCIIISDQANEK